MTGHETDDQRIAAAITAWSRSVFSAPRRLADLVTGVACRDETIERVATHVIRRELREVRTATTERRTMRPRLERATVDPFRYTRDTLKADSEHVAQCEGCGASGAMRCEPCRGTGHASCPSCHGTGKERSAKTGRPIKCKSCKATGVAPCRNCAGNGSIHCGACLGSGHQLAWLTYEEHERWEVSVPTSNPIVIAHRALREPRALSRDDVAAMTVVVERAHDGPLDPGELGEPERQTVRAQLAQIDPRLDRIRFQQYLELAALRRDVTFEMCGTRATLSLTGTQLVGATTPEVLRPIRRRLYTWLALCGLVALAGALLRGAVLGRSSYFQTANELSGLLIAAAVGCAIPALGALLRSWRGGLRFHPVRLGTKLWSAGAAAALVSIGIVGVVARPDPAEVQSALLAHDLARARAVVQALAEDGATRDTMDLEDRVALAEAARLSGDQRLHVLDAIAARKGASAAVAAAEATSQRLEQVRQLVATQRPTEALALLDRWFGDDHGVPVAEERARAHEAALTACSGVACQLGEAVHACAARSTPARVASVDAARARVVAALDPAQVDATQALPRLQQLRQLRDVGVAVTKLALDDADLQARARRAIELADAGRAAVPLLGNPLDVAEELLGSSTRAATGVPAISLGGVTVFLSLDRAGRCTGVYAVGDKDGRREIASEAWPASRLVSQAIGQTLALQPPSGSQSTTRLPAAATPVTVRWLGGAPVELRIGDATP